MGVLKDHNLALTTREGTQQSCLRAGGAYQDVATGAGGAPGYSKRNDVIVAKAGLPLLSGLIQTRRWVTFEV